MAFMADVDFRPDVYQIKQLNSVLVAHPDASMTSWVLNQLLLVAHSRSGSDFCW
jgi:hypothetical protein